MGAFSISLGAAVSIIISHTTSFFGFAEHRYDWRAETIVIAEFAAAALIGNPPRSIPGFEPGMLPENFDQRLPAGDIKDIAAFVAVVSKAAG